ncbi:hypothetical protein UPYG_G00144050 [Umbra pygmaea]|uniref:TFIIS N-terminal domain-containing protein n=1 Tax=Umbra pygmaea TaxID=75934 RepID=A0ABD0X066_UMBPY
MASVHREGALDLLKDLKGYNMTLRQLQETRIGMSVNGIRKHCTDDEVVALAKILIKDWKRLLDAPQTQSTEMLDVMKNGFGSNKPKMSPFRSPSEKDTRHKSPDVFDSNPEYEKEEQFDKRRFDKYKKDKAAGELTNERQTDTIRNELHAEVYKNGKHSGDVKKERVVECPKKEPHIEEPKQRHFEESRKEIYIPVYHQKHERDLVVPKKDSHASEHKIEKHTHKPEREQNQDEPRHQRHEEGHRKERAIYKTPQQRPTEKPDENHSQGFERKSILDDLYPSCCSSPLPSRSPRLPSSFRHTSVDVKKEVKKVMKKERKKAPPEPKATPPSLHLHPTLPKPNAEEFIKERKETPKSPVAQGVTKEPQDPNAAFAPLPLHLHPPLLKHASVEAQKERKETTDSKGLSLKKSLSDNVKMDRKDSSDRKVTKRPSVDAKKKRKDLSDSQPSSTKRPSLDVSVSIPKNHKSLDWKKDRKNSSDSKPSHSVTQHSSNSKSDRESHCWKSSHPVPPQRKTSMDCIDHRGKPKMPKTPTSPISPSFSSALGPLSPRLATGETIRDKCIEMLAAALRTDDNFKEFETNCESMAAEIEDHILLKLR